MHETRARDHPGDLSSTQVDRRTGGNGVAAFVGQFDDGVGRSDVEVGVVAGSAEQLVGRIGAGVQVVVTGTAAQHVGARPVEQEVVAVAAEQRVVARLAVDTVVAAQRVDRVVAGGAVQDVRAGAAAERGRRDVGASHGAAVGKLDAFESG